MERSAVVTLLAIVSIAAVASCGPAAVTPSPASPGIDWRRSLAVVERPEEAFTPPDPSTLVPRETGLSGHPAHFPGQAVMADVAWTGTEYVSIGYVSPGWTPIAWTSPDGDHWTIQRIGDTEFTFPVAIAVGQSGGVVAVGRSGPRPIAWTSPDGQRWASHGVPTLGTAGVAERMTTIVVTPDGYLAGGSVGPETLERHARYWRSPDGADWTPVADDPTAFADAEVRSIVRSASGYVAVGLLGTAVEPTARWPGHRPMASTGRASMIRTSRRAASPRWSSARTAGSWPWARTSIGMGRRSGRRPTAARGTSLPARPHDARTGRCG